MFDGRDVVERPTKSKFYAFEINEFRYRRVSFSVHNTLIQAEKAASKNAKKFVNGVSPVNADVSPMVLQGTYGLEAWALECGYDIDWENRMLIFNPPKGAA